MSPTDFAVLVDAHCGALILFARQWCAAPEDVVQDAFLKLVVAREKPRDVVAWLYRVVRNGAIDAGKIARRRTGREQAAARRESDTSRWFIEPEIDGLDAHTVVAALQHLSGDQRETIVAHLWGGLTFEQIATVSGCSASTAFRRYSTGIESLRKELGVPCPNHLPID
jgi:RNA polymerase sigma-70 factor (ECF subfamily)